MKNRNILVVEDDHPLSNLLMESLQSQQYKVTIASNGLEALEKFKTSSFTLVITDIQMPVMDGKELVVKLNEMDNPPVIFVMTANDERNTIIEIMKHGVHDYLFKPVDINDLLTKVERVFETNELKIMKEAMYKERAVRFESQVEWARWCKKVENHDNAIDQNMFQNMHVSFSQGIGFGALITLLNIIAETAVKENNKYVIDEEIMNTVIANSKIAEKAINTFSAIETIISNKLHSEKIGCDKLYKIFSDVAAELESKAELNSNKIIIANPKTYYNEIIIDLDVKLINEAIRELLINAIKFSEKGSDIFIICEKLTHDLSVSIINVPRKDEEGRRGIPIEYENIIFEPFYRLTKTVHEIYGTFDYGLGLTLVNKIIEKHNGNITARNILDHSDLSMGPQTKVEFNVTLPLCENV